MVSTERTYRPGSSLLNSNAPYMRSRSFGYMPRLALLLHKQLQDRMEEKGWKIEWARLRDNIDSVLGGDAGSSEK